jgi:hypothetical protein
MTLTFIHGLLVGAMGIILASLFYYYFIVFPEEQKEREKLMKLIDDFIKLGDVKQAKELKKRI